MKKTVLGIILLCSVIAGFVYFASKNQQGITTQTSPIKAQKTYSKNTWIGSLIDKNPQYKNMPVATMTENSISFTRPDGQTETDIVSSPINYKDENGNWKPINTTLTKKGDYFVGDGVTTKIRTDGTVEVEGQKFSQHTKGFGFFDPVTLTFTPVVTFEQGVTNENKFIRKGDGYKDEITVSDHGLKEELILERKLNFVKEGQLLVLETEVPGIDIKDGLIKGEMTTGDLHFPQPSAHDNNSKKPKTSRYANKIDGKQNIYTGVPASWLADAAYPVTIDPDYSANTSDGLVSGVYTPTYSTARASSDNCAAYLDNNWVGQDYDPWISIWRNYMKFDTTSIPDTDNITQVNMKLTALYDSSTTDFDVKIVKYNWAAYDPVCSGNQETVYDGILAATSDDNIWRNTSGMSLYTQYSSGNLDTNWVDKTGSTYYGLISAEDYNNSAPTNSEYIGVATQENATTGYRPVLTVVHTSTVTPTPTPPGSTTIQLQINSDADDYSICPGMGDFEPSSLVFGAGPFCSWWVGSCFGNVTVPKGAFINSAFLTYTSSDNRSTTNVNTKIYGVAADNATPATTFNEADAEPSTTASTTWNAISAWTTDTEYSSPDIKSVIQEIVNRAGFASGNKICLLHYNNVSDVAVRAPYSHESSPSKATKLQITYSTPIKANAHGNINVRGNVNVR